MEFERWCSECVNGSLMCTGRPCRHACTADEYQCPGEDRCIPKAYLCDGIVDCTSKKDEIGCGELIVVLSNCADCANWLYSVVLNVDVRRLGHVKH